MDNSDLSYKKINSVKAIIENPEEKILLIQEPETDEWMPLHWGLPGGRPKVKESLHDAFKRTLQEEIGVDIEPLGIYRIEELLHDDRTVLMFIAVAKVFGGVDIKGRIKTFKWVTAEEIEKMDTLEFTAFYEKKLLLDYLAGNREYIDFNLVETQQYFDLDENPEFQKWLESGKKNVKSSS